MLERELSMTNSRGSDGGGGRRGGGGQQDEDEVLPWLKRQKGRMLDQGVDI